jgi:hypothetical protein
MSARPVDRGLGAKPYRPDDRDFTLRAVRATVSEEPVARRFYSMKDPSFRIDQGQEGTCVAHSCVNVLVAGPSRHDAYSEFADIERAHQWARKLYVEASGDVTYQQGMYPRDACSKLAEWGLIESYWRLPSVDETIAYVQNYGPVKFASPWYYSNYFKDNKLTEAYGNWYMRVNPDSELMGYHDWAITGVDLEPEAGPPYVRMENSWGADFGFNGTARIPVDSLHVLYDGDAWVLRETGF